MYARSSVFLGMYRGPFLTGETEKGDTAPTCAFEVLKSSTGAGSEIHPCIGVAQTC